MNITTLNLDETGTVALRKLARDLGIKGMSSAKGADLRDAIRPIQTAQIEAAKPAPATKRGSCTDCGRREDFRGSGLCEPCREYAEWENTHSDRGHEIIDGVVTGEDTDGCQVCYPELDRRKPRLGTTTRTGVSRLGQVIIAKGTEYHKSSIFKAAAEAAGYAVEIDDTSAGYLTATATKGTKTFSLVWFAGAYLYGPSTITASGKVRKVRNLKEALRLI